MRLLESTSKYWCFDLRSFPHYYQSSQFMFTSSKIRGVTKLLEDTLENTKEMEHAFSFAFEEQNESATSADTIQAFPFLLKLVQEAESAAKDQIDDSSNSSGPTLGEWIQVSEPLFKRPVQLDEFELLFGI